MGGAFLLSRRFALLPVILSHELDTQYEHPLQRVLQRLQAIMHHTYIDEADIFYRNLIMSHQLLLMRSALNQDNHKPKIAFNVGAFHSGIEDLLLLGPDFCRSLIVNLPSKELLQAFVDANGGIDTFAGCRILTRANKNTDQVIIDPILKNMVSEKLS